jgi:serine/threonine-protein kinase HipA
MTWTPVTAINVGLNFGNETMPVGSLLLNQGRIYFEYNTAFLQRGLNLSPLHLPLEPGPKTFDPHLFDGLPGVLGDSLPDGWGRWLLDRTLRQRGVQPQDLSGLDRLAHVGMQGMGALVYEPDQSEADSAPTVLDLDTLAVSANEVFEGESDAVLAELLALNGSSAGARPKVVVGVDTKREKLVHGTAFMPTGYTPWLVKFNTRQDGADAGAVEYVYSLMAKAAGLAMAECYLFPAVQGPGYFGTQRFDREKDQRLHMHTAAGLLHANFREPALDYEDLLALTGNLTRDIRDVEMMFRIAVFNVLAHNRDDHGKNFSYLMNANGEWHLAPAYDLTFSSGPRGWQSTSVMAQGQTPGIEHLIKLGAAGRLDKKLVEGIIAQTRDALSQWEALANEYGVSKVNIKLIASRLFNKV